MLHRLFERINLGKYVAELYATPKEVIGYVRSLELHQKKRRKKK